MGWLYERKRKKAEKRRYCGHDRKELSDMIDILCILEVDIGMTDEEHEAMEMGIQALCDIYNAMTTDRKVVFDDYRSV